MKKIDKAEQYVREKMVKSKRCRRCGYPVCVSENKKYKYQCFNCDEDLYSFETAEGCSPTKTEIDELVELVKKSAGSQIEYVFNNAEEMLSVIKDEEIDLYCRETQQYVFLYNDIGSIAVYEINNKEAEELKKTGEMWSGFLGPGGEIYDDPDYEDCNPDTLNNLEYCKIHFDDGVWEVV